MRTRRALATAAAVSVVLVGCGSSKPKTDAEQVRSVAQQFATAFVDGDYKKACSLMTSEAKADLLKAAVFLGNEGGGCEGLLKAAASFLDEGDKVKLQNYKIKSLSITGDIAKLTDNTGESTRLRKKAGKWLVDSEPENATKSSGSTMPNESIDEMLGQNRSAPAPRFSLEVLQQGALPARLRDVAAPLADGRLALDEVLGTPMVLNLWASWCKPCREEAPRLEAAWQRLGRRGVLFLGLDIQDIRSDARSFSRALRITYPTIREPGKEIAKRYSATGIPETYFISAKGLVIGHVIGAASDSQIASGSAAALAGEAAR
jgi:thiol-disulfide isomerase/thioredoxin